ncbi:Outer membrane scaffolding protein for murein synthesis, MipA/OmpV family [Duganella sacchari]|uniref:Outer membrane scaffolding protein for murein synthesis, MipA/OmpV family n=1 Tax=Duganella sacchari TaxID=551987 RepID=A0A1M7IUW5_9BURK|nr:MipA/OmpV family protein [Duganella sacchari]SHM44433.1 Outer membrane scaffolding protein for murein synthesis, MipA/OmpV family [Duganella sacchari]
MKKHPSLMLGAVCLLSAASACAAEPDGQFAVGGGIGAGPRYAGSDRNVVSPVIVLDYTHASGFFASSLRGVGYGYQAGPFTYSTALGYRGERKEKNEKALFGNNGSEELKGMGDVKGNASAIVSIGIKPLPILEFNVSADVPLSQRENGKTIHTGITAQLLDGRNDTLSLSAGAGFADSKYAQTYHGVTAQQALTSNFKAFTPKSGLYEANLMLTWQHKFSNQWSVTALAGANTLLRDASKSPLTKRKTSPAGGFYVSYLY